MQDRGDEDSVARAHEVASEQPEREYHDDQEQQEHWRVGDVHVCNREDCSLEHVGRSRAQEKGVALQEQPSEEQLFLKAVGECHDQQGWREGEHPLDGEVCGDG